MYATLDLFVESFSWGIVNTYRVLVKKENKEKMLRGGCSWAGCASRIFSFENMKNQRMLSSSSPCPMVAYRELKASGLRLICDELRASCRSTTDGAPPSFATICSLRLPHAMSQWLGVLPVLRATCTLCILVEALTLPWKRWKLPWKRARKFHGIFHGCGRTFMKEWKLSRKRRNLPCKRGSFVYFFTDAFELEKICFHEGFYGRFIGSFHGRFLGGELLSPKLFRGSEFASTEAFTEAFTELYSNPNPSPNP